MTATLRGGRYVDCHQAGAYLLELESAESAECGGGGKLGTALTLRSLRSSRESQSELGSSGADRALFRITSLTLAFELAELRQELSRMEQPSPSLPASDGAAPSAMMLEMVRINPTLTPTPNPDPYPDSYPYP